jgi:hypothetical protein
MAMSRSSSSKPTERSVFGSPASGGGVIVALVFVFFDEWTLSGPCGPRFAFDFAIVV